MHCKFDAFSSHFYSNIKCTTFICNILYRYWQLPMQKCRYINDISACVLWRKRLAQGRSHSQPFQSSKLFKQGPERYAEPPSNAVECVLVDRTQRFPVCDGLRRLFYTGGKLPHAHRMCKDRNVISVHSSVHAFVCALACIMSLRVCVCKPDAAFLFRSHYQMVL